MENTRKSTLDLETLAWGTFFHPVGDYRTFPIPTGWNRGTRDRHDPARSQPGPAWKGEPTSGFTTTLGILALLLGGLQLASPYLQLPFELPIFAILLIALGLMILIRAMKK